MLVGRDGLERVHAVGCIAAAGRLEGIHPDEIFKISAIISLKADFLAFEMMLLVSLCWPMKNAVPFS